jgi:hypothetical protein
MRIGIGLVIAALAATPASATANETEIKFTPCDGMICMPVVLSDGKSHLLLLDTGNVSCWMTAETAQSLGKTLEPVKSEDKPIPGVFRIGSENFSLGATSLSARFLAFDASVIGTLPKGVAGGIAYTALKDLVLEINYPRQTLRIGGDALKPAHAQHGAIKLITFGTQGPPIVTIDNLTVNGHPFTAQYDTGFTGPLVVYDKAIGQLGLQGASTHGKPKFFPYTDGGITLNESAFGQVSFGTVVLESTPARIYFPGSGKNPVHQPDGLFEATVGNALFVRQIVTLDFRTMEIYVSPPG